MFILWDIIWCNHQENAIWRTFILKTLHRQDVTSFCHMPRTLGDSWKVSKSLSNLENIHPFHYWNVRATFGCHVVWPQKHDEYFVLYGNLCFGQKFDGELWREEGLMFYRWLILCQYNMTEVENIMWCNQVSSGATTAECCTW